ncbi:MAG: DUF3617 family protein [Alphaproteobacteria bacterium]|nr:DUF3617 family protein [Alphaproteobacteria bacterium]
MRKSAALLLCLGAAACGGAPEEKKPAEVPALLPAGTWTVASEITALRSLDKTTPAIKAKVGDKDSLTVCVDKPGPQPPANMFAGTGYECGYKSAYIKDGMLNATIDCRRADVDGSIMMTVQGSYTATGFTGTAETTAYLPGAGDFAMSRTLTGSVKGGACTPAPPPPPQDKDEG